mmetsp:Transcript_19381/g.35093  ORF Transcript_19381/g.35093 Transcript_19381/m.35093 type:complete len:281 (+) Transcript_19381:108-950(+)|eukprot:CAMPEP_0202495046 /NCGR_PEP_ID=MMETSP1361-20130828/14955_1 /ASSEMBLY_ACC=CAM_ASM_000849 /TAXON_ID=210615 /ORGANISM="Staurosira complex sp., Strain CCMP2646" /LENGTH=280 /DNA_ID=CAMNT_0049125895 /DNA_START=30 /DNA_END=872 /DNA_ORIENTATION=+
MNVWKACSFSQLARIFAILTLLHCLSSGASTAEQSCLVKGYNEELNVDDVFEVDMDMDVIQKIRADYEKDVLPYLETGKSTDDFCLTSPYNAETKIWDEGDGHVERSDMKWYSPRNKETFDKYLAHAEALGLKDLVGKELVDTDDVAVYNILFLVRSRSEKLHFHLDWNDKLGTNAMTFLVPLNNFTIHMKYYDNDDVKQRYLYKYGKAVGFGGGFWHTTEKGHGEEQDVLFCVYLGSTDKDLWEKYVLNNIGDESGYYNDPFRGFMKNENVPPEKDICL